MNRKIKYEGISLIVLVITIIVMIILAGAIIVSLNNGNAIAKAKVAKESTDFTGIREMVDMERGNMLLNSSATVTRANVTIPSTYNSDIEVTDSGTILIKYNAATKINDIASAIDQLGAVYIPSGFTASQVTGENKKEDGLVIYQTTTPVTDSTAATAATTINQFVWVPVENYNEFVRQDFGTQGITSWTTVPKTSGMYFEKAATVNGTDEVSLMQASVAKYNGFYIARYESANYNNNTGIAISQKNKTVWQIAWGGSGDNTSAYDGAGGNDADTSGAVYKARAMISNAYVQTTIPYGVQWDAIMRWFNSNGINVKSGPSWGNYDIYLAVTGSNEKYKAKNIYDIAGNVREWTMEAKDEIYRVTRDSAGPAGRYAKYTDDNTWHGFHAALYIK